MGGRYGAPRDQSAEYVRTQVQDAYLSFHEVAVVYPFLKCMLHHCTVSDCASQAILRQKDPTNSQLAVVTLKNKRLRRRALKPSLWSNFSFD